MTTNIGRVVGVKLYATDAVVVREGHRPTTHEQTRGEVTEFTDKSRARLAFVASNTTVTFRTMITLTYPREYPEDGHTVKSHLRQFLQAWRRYTHNASYLWFLEFQSRGAPHFHILTDYPTPSRRADRKSLQRWVSQRWYDICGTGDTRHLAAGTRTERLRSPEGGAHYAVKYAQKMKQKHVPELYRNVGRFWGHTRDVKPKPIFEYECSEEDIREALAGQPYEPPRNRPLWHTLYNKAAIIAEVATEQLDKGS